MNKVNPIYYPQVANFQHQGLNHLQAVQGVGVNAGWPLLQQAGAGRKDRSAKIKGTCLVACDICGHVLCPSTPPY